MRKLKIACTVLSAGLAALASVPVTAQQQASSSGDEAREQNPVSTITCRRYPPPTGSRIGPRRVCKTQHEWDLIDQETRDVMENVGNRNRVGNE